jgi:hypothetical protein
VRLSKYWVLENKQYIKRCASASFCFYKEPYRFKYLKKVWFFIGTQQLQQHNYSADRQKTNVKLIKEKL